MCLGITYIAQANVLNERRVERQPLHYLLQHLEDDAVERGVLQSALLPLAQRRPDCHCDHDIVGVLSRSVPLAVSFFTSDTTRRPAFGQNQHASREAHIAATPDLVGDRWEKIELKRSAAIVHREPTGSVNKKRPRR